VLDANSGEIWAKLDAGSDEYFQRIDRPNVSLTRVLESIRDAARLRPIVIQSLFMRVNGQAMPPAEVEAYCDRLNWLLAEGGQIKAIQIHTIARRPADPSVTQMPDDELDRMADIVCARVQAPVETYYGAG
jgi:wyosine [tRNA(Phe)-imidazoG37] synthetase (radical SAM superfamily)